MSMYDATDWISRAMARRRPGVAPGPRPVDPYRNMLQDEGIFTAQRAGLAAEDAAQRSGMQSAIDALRFRYSDPANPYSQIAQLQRQHSGAVGNLRARRAARGTLYSGGTALQEADLGYQRGLGEYGASNALLEGIGGLEAGYASDARARMLQQQDFLGDAQRRLLEAGLSPADQVPAPALSRAGRPPRPQVSRRFAGMGRGMV